VISVTYRGREYSHPGYRSPRALFGIARRAAAVLDGPVLSLVPRLLGSYSQIAASADSAVAAGVGAVAAHRDAVAEALQGRPLSALLADLTADPVLDVVDEVLQGATVDGAPAGGTHAWHASGDPWGPHAVAALILWTAQGFSWPGGSRDATGEAEDNKPGSPAGSSRP
jgi:hypothetical protein